MLKHIGKTVEKKSLTNKDVLVYTSSVLTDFDGYSMLAAAYVVEENKTEQ